MHQIKLQRINMFKLTRLNELSGTTCCDVLMMIRGVFNWYIVENYARTGDMLDNP